MMSRFDMTTKRIVVLCGLFGGALALHAAANGATVGQLPMSFELNQGQTDESVRFLSRQNDYGLFLTPTEVVWSLRSGQQESASTPRTDAAPTALRMAFPGASPNPRLVGLDLQPGRANYFVGNNPKKWRADIPIYARVAYRSLYPGIDLVFYGNKQDLEYDFVVAPHADPSEIAMTFSGADAIDIDQSTGDLLLRTPAGTVRQHKPTVYQEIGDNRRTVDAQYIIGPAGRIGFEISSYDLTRPLTIDPILVYSTYLGGDGDELSEGSNLAVDSAGNAYITGATSSANFPTTPGAHDEVCNSCGLPGGAGRDLFVTKLSADGSTLEYSTYVGGGASDFPSGIAVDLLGNVYVTGLTASLDFPTVNPFQSGLNGSLDSFVTKLSADGSALLYSTYLGGTARENGFAIAVDAAGSAYVAGETTSSTFPTTNATLSPNSCGGSRDGFVTKLSVDGSSLVYSTYLCDGGFDRALAIAVDTAGNAYVAGAASSSTFPQPFGPTSGAFQTSFGGGASDGYLTKLNPAGSALVYSTLLGGSSTSEQGAAVAVGTLGNAYVVGQTDSSNFPLMNAVQPLFGGVLDATMTKLSADGATLVYSTYLGGSDSDSSTGVAVDALGNAFISGFTVSPDFPTVNALQPSTGGNGDGFVTKLNAAGSAFIYSTYLGGSDFDHGIGIGVDSSGAAIVGGAPGRSTSPQPTRFSPP